MCSECRIKINTVSENQNTKAQNINLNRNTTQIPKETDLNKNNSDSDSQESINAMNKHAKMVLKRKRLDNYFNKP